MDVGLHLPSFGSALQPMEETVNLSPEERMEIMLNVMERVYGEVMDAQELTALLPLVDTPPGHVSENPLLPLPAKTLSMPAIIDSHLRSPAPTVQELVNRISPLPDLTAVMGICRDGLPLLFDLADPYPGAMLVLSSQPEDLPALFNPLLLSIASLNATQQVRYSMISETPHKYLIAAGEQHCLGNYSAWEREALEHIFACSEVVEQRRSGREMGATHILVIDDLHALLSIRNQDLNINLKWLARNGARQGVWILAGVDSQTEHRLPGSLIAEFKTVIYGRLNQAQRLRKINPPPRQAFGISPGEFVTRLGSQWVQFSPLEFT